MTVFKARRDGGGGGRRGVSHVWVIQWNFSLRHHDLIHFDEKQVQYYLYFLRGTMSHLIFIENKKKYCSCMQVVKNIFFC